MTKKARSCAARERERGGGDCSLHSTLNPACNEFVYNEHLSVRSSFFSQKGNFLLTSVFKNFGYNGYRL